jgi:hypothetical protein
MDQVTAQALATFDKMKITIRVPTNGNGKHMLYPTYVEGNIQRGSELEVA